MKKKNFLIGMIAGVLLILALNYGTKFFISPSYGLSSGSRNDGLINVSEKIDLMNAILKKYYVNDFDDDELIETMEKAMLYGYVNGVGDEYTTYMDPEVYKSYTESSEGKFAGIGVNVSMDFNDNRITISTPFEGFPADKAGMKAGDKVIGVDGVSIEGLDLQESVNLIKGEEGTTVTLTIYRESEGNIFDLDVIREIVEIPTIISKQFDNIGYIMITNFDRVTRDQFKEAYDNLLNVQNVEGLIIDVRNNPGGLLDVVADIADILIPEGLIVYTEDKNGKQEKYNSDANKIEIPLAMLMNGSSASASEVLGGAVQDTNSGVLIGTQSFGKGVVQNLIPLGDGSAMKITIAKYYTPNGISIDGVGLTPDYEVTMDNSLSFKLQELTLDEDVQLQKAIEVVTDQIK